jgi:RHS repeat-associated protein
VRGVVFTVTGPAGGTASGRVHVSLDYASFAGAYGGDYASRLHLVELPACALSTPQVPACRAQVPLVSADDVRASAVGADVILPAAAVTAAAAGGAAAGGPVLTAETGSVVSPGVVLAATAATEGSGGNFGAEPLSEQDEWVTGGSSGAYTYSYPVDVPPVPGGLEPAVALDYDSQSVDGLNASTNNQASWIGDGWDYEPGFVEEDYPTCATNALDPDTLDLCSTTTPEITVTMDGTTTPLVVTSGSSHLEADGAEQVSRTSDGGYEIIEPDGTQYWFGVNDLPGYVSGDQATSSIWTVPLWDDGTFSTVPWRWMLDYVVDPHQDAIAYFYDTQTNYYAEDGGSKADGAYTQGGVLARIEYGLRAGSIYSQTPAGVVTFTSGTAREDAPADLACTSGAACSVHAPTFWTTYQLSGIQTQSLVNGSLRDAGSWTLAGTYPATGDPATSPSLWLSAITRTGEDGTTPVTLPPVSFAGTAMADLAQTSTDKKDGYSLITRYRLTAITNEYGGVTSIAYSAESAACKAGTFPQDYSNTGMCYPDYWYTNALTDVSREDWYNLYDVSAVTETDTTGGDPPQVTAYTYASPAWHYDNDTISRSVNWTWDQWRGFRSVITETGTAPDPVTETADTYFQGMSEDSSDYRFSGGIITGGSVSLTSARGNTVQDLDQYAGMLFEEIIYNGAGTGSEVTDTIDTPYTSAATATDPALYQSSYITGTTSTATYTALASGGAREATTAYTYNSSGQVLTDSDVPDTSQAGESTCTTTTYDPDTATSIWLVDLPEQVTVTSGACGSSGATTVSDTQYQYDGGAYAAVPSAGNVTQENQVDATAAGATVSEEYTDDEYGRILTSTDADHRTTTTAYTPATGAEPSSVQVTDPMGLVTTTTYDPARELGLTVTDPAGYVATTSYDALGRETAEWTAGNPTSDPATDTWSYTVSNTAPTVTTEQVEEPNGGYLTTETLDDSFGHTREVQQETASGDTNVTDITYNSDGLQALVSSPYYVDAPPSATLVAAASSSVPSQAGYVYDGDGRVIKQIAYADGTETWETDTTYGGDYVTVTPPAGGTPETTWTDGRGRTTAIWQYHSGAPVSTSDPASDYDATTYTSTPAGQLATITDADGNEWSYTYDQLGDQLTQTTPDAGTTTSTYDNAGQLMSVTDARGKTISDTYDADGRKTAEYDTTGGALEMTSDELASWTYDTLAKGQPTSSTAYENGASYTEEVTGYNSQELPSGTETIIPSAQGNLAGTYTQTDTYAPDGKETSYTDSAAGGLPAETVTTEYDAAGDPDTLTGSSSYVNSLSYTDLDQPLQYTMGTSSEPAYITDSYDPQTGNLTEQDTQTGAAETSIDDLHYTYNDVSDVTSEADTPSGNSSATDVQCFQYDYLNRLVQAWAQGSTACASTPSASAEGGVAPYWESYTYNTVGNLAGITSTTSSGAVTAITDTYPNAEAAHPHAITGQSVTTSSGTTNSSYGYDADGNLTTVTGTAEDQALTWDDAGQLTQDAVTPSGGSAQDTDYVYAADGSLLLTADPGTTTLYLSDEELSLNTSTDTVSGTRYYTLGDTTVATLTGASSLAYLVGDQQGTESVAINASTLAVTNRYYDPYGNPRGTTPSSFPSGEKGFVGGTSDTDTGLTDLGAREYQPGTGSFVTTDSVLKPYDPQDLNPYTYATDNPATFSDPTGEMSSALPGEPCAGIANPQTYKDCEIDQSRLQQSQICPGNGTNPGGRIFYTNVTPICGPPQPLNDDQPWSVEGLTGQWFNSGGDNDTEKDMLVIEDALYVKGYDLAADFVSDYLDNTGAPVQLDQAQMEQMLNDMPRFKAEVQADMEKCETRGQVVCNLGWQKYALDDKNEKLTNSEIGWYYALGSWYFDVSGYKDTNGQWHFNLNVFKYYAWGNPHGGVPKGNLCAPHTFSTLCVSQNAISQLNADGQAQNFDVWGTYNLPNDFG